MIFKFQEGAKAFLLGIFHYWLVTTLLVWKLMHLYAVMHPAPPYSRPPVCMSRSGPTNTSVYWFLDFVLSILVGNTDNDLRFSQLQKQQNMYERALGPTDFQIQKCYLYPFF